MPAVAAPNPSGASQPRGPTSDPLADAIRALAHAAAALAECARSLGGTNVAPAQPPASFLASDRVHGRTQPCTPHGSPTLAQAVADMVAAKRMAGRSDCYVRQLRHHLDAFARDRKSTPLDAITQDDVEAWLGHGRAARTRWNRLQYLRTLFAWGRRRGWCQDPTACIERPTLPTHAPGIHTPDQVAAILKAARARSPNLCRILAVRYFAGLRTAEAGRLTESDLGPEWVNVPAAKAKTRQRRLVAIRPALRAWLDLGGTLPSRTMEQETCALVSTLGIPWPRNAARHSWCSYHLAAFGSAANTALEAGHSEAMLFRHYRALVTPEAAAAFWAIRPT